MCSRPCRPRSVAHIGTQLRCYEPRGAMSCGSPMPRGERIARPAEWDTHVAGLLFFVVCDVVLTRRHYGDYHTAPGGPASTPLQGRIAMSRPSFTRAFGVTVIT